MNIPSYSRRYFGQLGIWRFGDWAIKAYGISVRAPETEGPFLDASLMEEAQAYVSKSLGRMNETPHYSLGFAILHHGSGAKSLLTQCVGQRMRLSATCCSGRIYRAGEV